MTDHSPRFTAYIRAHLDDLEAEEALVLAKIAECESAMANSRLDIQNSKTEIIVYRQDLTDIRAQRAELHEALR